MPIFYKPNISDEQYKIEQIEFVSDYSGSSYLLLLSMFVINIYLNYFHHLLHHYFPVLHSHFVVYVLSDLFISIPAILIPMFFSSIVYPLVIILTIIYIVVCCHYPKRQAPTIYPAVSVGFVEFRSMINLWTLIAILAVDFHIFPRMHTKSEFYGLSLMDTGVGAIVVCSGVAAGLKENKTPYFKNLISTVIHSLPFFIIGFIRLFATRATGYQHHISEYGMHMNFFFVLGFVQILTGLIHSPRKYCGIVSIILIIGYEIILQYFDLYNYSLKADRTSNLFAANREGLLSIIGYTTIQIASTSMGYYYTLGGTKQYRFKLDVIIVIIAFIGYISYEIISLYVPPCRPLINLTYFIALMSQMMICYAICDVIPMYLPVKQTAGSNGLSLNQLPLFLIANLITGTVNLLFYTLYVPTIDSIVIIFIYIAIVRIMAFCLGYFHITFKIQSMQLVILNDDYRTPYKSYSLFGFLHYFKSLKLQPNSSNKKDKPKQI
ncbi:GPI-anchored wall transfer protein, putative [Entamoeba dispar SAW760]|uniref:GPI-anchored wall transfer protein, putative n=1 Tax=Entamoeba dispar (strain ATCC PRA-260 / SAW760) TaxID=370354 RepID=B0EJ34_ENTDS|nr:GPI-anchored wall transfer protein, putative [Entamoeba dispar SAW760]EDR25460.1 GPI-anchored wall transfer protein, putative [Entamoeba dispar SAW760]|eukprot:EDR25460.1 GPI-anchored wall transfer protein, putative [Entamoeba dispar SAW760]